MAFPSDTFTGDSGDLDVYIPAKWGDKINEFTKDALICAKFFTDRSYELSDGGNTIYTPGMTEMTANSKTNGSAVTLNSPTETAVTLTVNTWYETSFAIEDREAVQFKKSYYTQETYAKGAAFTTAAVLEDAIITLFDGFSQSVGASTSVVVDSDIRKALGLIEAATKEDADRGNVAGFFETKVYWNQIAGITTYQLNTNSPEVDPVMKRPARWFYGVPFYTTSRIKYVSSTTGRINAIAHRDAIHWATAPLPGQKAGNMVRVQSNYVPEYLSTVTTADILYGVVENRDLFGVKFYSSAA